MHTWKLLVATHVAASLTGYVLAPREMLETEVESAGLFTTDTKRVLAAAVQSLRAENKLLVYTYKGTATVSVERSKLWLLTGRQELLVPASVGYYVNLSSLTVNQVDYDALTGTVTVSLPPLVLGDIAFEPEDARTINDGLLTYSQAQVDELSKLNFRSARRAFVKQAQGRTLVDAARESGRRAVEALVTAAVASTGARGVRVRVVFERA